MRSAWEYMALYGITWQYMAVHGSIWQYMAVHGRDMALYGIKW